MLKKISLFAVIFFISFSSAGAQNKAVPQAKPGGDASLYTVQNEPEVVTPKQGYVEFTDPNGKGRIGSYEMLVELPGLPRVIDPGLDEGGPGTFTLPQYIRSLVRIAIGVIGILAVVMIVVAGVQYMGSGMVTEKESARQRLTGAVLGLILAVSSVLLLRTINPQLTTLKIGNEQFTEGVEGKAYKIGLPTELVIEYLDTLPKVSLQGGDTGDEMFLGYLAHQQGPAGASAILWAAKNNYKTVPPENPYVKGNSVNSNMKTNWNTKSAQENIRTSELTPANFINYWAMQVKKIKTAQKPAIEPSINAILTKVAQEDGVNLLMLQTFCRIESYKQCSTKESITYTNTYGYTGLFQFGADAWKDYGKGSRTDAYENTKAAVRLHKANMAVLKKNGF